MKNIIILFAFSLLGIGNAWAQSGKYFSKNATIIFDAEGKLDDVEEIKAKTTNAICVYDSSNGRFEWSVGVKSFSFANSLMQEHFNENYLESEKYPKASFAGKVENYSNIHLDKDGTYPATVSGKLTIHGVTRDIKIDGKFIIKGDKIDTSSSFEVTFKDYNVEIPKLVLMKVAESAKVNVSAQLQPLKK